MPPLPAGMSFSREAPSWTAGYPEVARIGQRECLHLSLVLPVCRLLMCLVTAFCLTKNEYDSKADKAFAECRQISRSSRRARLSAAQARTAVGRRRGTRCPFLNPQDIAHETSPIGHLRLSRPDDWNRGKRMLCASGDQPAGFRRAGDRATGFSARGSSCHTRHRRFRRQNTCAGDARVGGFSEQR